MSIFLDELVSLKDEKNRLFTKKLIPNIELDNILGVSIPKLRTLAKKLFKDRNDDVVQFLKELPHKYLEENTLHSFFISQYKDLGQVISLTDDFLPHIDNWAVCDSFIPKVFDIKAEQLLPKIEEWISSSHAYTVRFGIGLLLKYFLDELFKVEYLSFVANINSEEYYINMMIAWFFAEALIKQKEATLPFIQEKRLPKWTHNKAIQKACESRRIESAFKLELKQMKIK